MLQRLGILKRRRPCSTNEIKVTCNCIYVVVMKEESEQLKWLLLFSLSKANGGLLVFLSLKTPEGIIYFWKKLIFKVGNFENPLMGPFMRNPIHSN